MLVSSPLAPALLVAVLMLAACRPSETDRKGAQPAETAAPAEGTTHDLMDSPQVREQLIRGEKASPEALLRALDVDARPSPAGAKANLSALGTLLEGQP